MCKYGDIYIAELDTDVEGSLQSGTRPIIVISNNKANQYSPVISVIPLTTKRKRHLPTHVLIKDCGLPRPSVVLAEQITALNQSRLQRKVGSIQGTVYEKQVKKAIEIQLNL